MPCAMVSKATLLAVAAAASAQGQGICTGREPVANTLLSAFTEQPPVCEVPGPCLATHWTATANCLEDEEAEEPVICLRAPSCEEIQAASGPITPKYHGGPIGIGRRGGKYCENAENVEQRRGFPFTAVKIPNSHARFFRKNPTAKRYQSFCVTKEANGETPAVIKRIKNTRVKEDENLFAAISERAACPGQTFRSPFNPYDDRCGKTYAFDALQVYTQTIYPGSFETKTMNMDGMDREYYIFTPKSVLEERASNPNYRERMMVEIHGLTSCAEFNPFYTKWLPIASAEGFVLVLPVGTQFDGINPLTQEFGRSISSWNAGLIDFPSALNGVDDSKFIKKIVTDMTGPGGIADATRVFIAGHSNGAAMAQRVAYESPELFAAIATHSFYLLTLFDPRIEAPESVVDGSALGLTPYFSQFGIPARVFGSNSQLPAYHVHGNADAAVPYDFCPPGLSTCISSPGAEGNNLLWALINTCKSTFTNPAGVREMVGTDDSFTLTHSQCGAINGDDTATPFVGDKEVQVKLLTLNEGSHNAYLGSPDSKGVPESVDSTQLAWDFIKDYQRKPQA